MKKIFLSSLAALAVLLTIVFTTTTGFSVPKAKFDSPHFTELCYDAENEVFVGKVAGLGTNNPANYSIAISGSFGCDNPADKKPPAWQGFTISGIPLQSSTNSGTYTFSAPYSFDDCNRNWTQVINATATIVSGSRSFDRSSVPICE